jgi:predicted nuclease of restriction endonuclease-like (RecB) superfamily
MTKMSPSFDQESYVNLLSQIKNRVRLARFSAMRKVNAELIMLYWDLGRVIFEAQEKQGWGKGVVEQLEADLKEGNPSNLGLSARNLWYTLKFYNTYQGYVILQQLTAEIGWGANMVILDRCKTLAEREFYLRMTGKFGWSQNVLKLQIQNQAFQKAAMNQQNFEKTLSPERAAQAILAIKDDYTFDFLELAEEHTERELERALLQKISRFLTEMGGQFTFVGNQYRLNVGGDDFYIDLLLYHRSLQCLVAIELKTVEFRPEFAGKMQFYLTALNKQVKMPHENNSIGMILCTDKNRTVVEYALSQSAVPVGVGTYTLSPSLPKELEGKLPSPESITKLVDSMRRTIAEATQPSAQVEKKD